MPGGGCEHIASGERGTGRGKVIVGVVEHDDTAGAACDRRRRREQSVVGAEQHAAVDLDRHQAPVGAHPRVDHRHENGVFRQVLHRPHEQQRSGPDVVGGDVVAEVEDGGAGSEPQHHCLADPDELVSEPVVGSERDDHGPRLGDDRPAASRASGLAVEGRHSAGAAPVRESAGLCVARTEVGVYVDVAHPERPPHAHRRQLARFDDAVDRHGRYPHQIRDFLNCQESRRGE